ncbi:MAG: 2-(1,2-epoxy,2-dihydrophenyl)acetyl-CoA isomerase, partial [Chloroflexota bacterium]|nr:2-(1,2-epoxy,2-dihydrophenyl)acetyl-CoA isomerase [Chloroflexota bacterium]
LSAEEAERLGIVNRVVDGERLEQETVALAARLAGGPRIALMYMKENLNRAENGDELGECMDLEATHHLRTMLTKDHREAAAAFADKRQPTFRGR